VRYRFIDRVPAIDAAAGTITTVKTFPRTADYYDGTFRDEGEVPSSLILEAVAATGSFLILVRSRYYALGLLLKISRSHFTRPLRSGERLVVEAGITGIQGDLNAIFAPDFPIAEVHATARTEAGEVGSSNMLFLCLPMGLIFGEWKDIVLDDSLELLGLRDARP
jgi:3-hydroxymyristoyl/3-hydroxydecanoyl-(acyl carrier protein) dehydratase